MDSDWDCRLGSRVQKADELGVKEAVSLGYTDDRSHVIKTHLRELTHLNMYKLLVSLGPRVNPKT